MFGKSLHQQEYQILKKVYEEGSSKSQAANIFHNQEVLAKVQLSPPEAIEEYTGVKRGNIKAFYGDCAMIPDTSELDAMENNLLVLDDCFLGPQSKAEAYYTRGRHNICDFFTYLRITFDYPVKL